MFQTEVVQLSGLVSVGIKDIMSNKLPHEYRKFLRNCYTLRRILRDTQQLLEELSASNLLPHENLQSTSKLEVLQETLYQFPALVFVGPSSLDVVHALLENLEHPLHLDASQILLVSHTNATLHLNNAVNTNAESSALQVHQVQLNHPLLRDGLQIVVSSQWSSLNLKTLLPIVLYGVKNQQLSSEELKELVQLRFQWHEIPLCFVCLESLGDGQLTDFCQQLETVGFLPGTGIGVEQISGVAGFVKCCLQAHLVKASLTLNDVQSQYLRSFILSAFDMARELQITPRRLRYAQEKESELHQGLMRVASDKQLEITQLIENTLQDMRAGLLDKAAETEANESAVSATDSAQALKAATQEVQQLVLGRLSRSVASQLVQSVDCLQHSYVGTLQRCLQSLERHCQDSGEGSLLATDALRQSLSAAYCVELSACPSSLLTSLLERLRQLLRGLTLPWSPTPQLDAGWRRQVAADILDSLSAARLARSICSQFRERVRSSHEAFQEALRSLENRLCGRLERTEEQRVAIRKHHAPRLARLALESTSMCDMVRYGMPNLGKEIGRGQYGVVFACDSWGGTGPCAVKSVVPPDDKHWNDLAMEFYYTRTLPEHRRIVRVRGSVVDAGYGGGCSPAVLLVMDRLCRDLYCGLRAGMSWLRRIQVAIDVVEGVRFLHAQGLVHRDIKLKNVLV
ncbi:hypothetical protein B566_EDAN008292, partial [Ephemera danica]